MDHGVTHSEAAAAIHIATNPKNRIGGATRRPGTPAARIAVISPSLDIRESVIKVATRTPSGMVNGSACGSTSANRYATVESGPELRTRNSKRGRARCRNSTNVNSTEPSIAVTTISRRMVRLSRRIGGASGIRRGNDGGLLQLILRPLELHLLEQQAGGDDGGGGQVSARSQPGQWCAIVDV